MPGWRRNFLSDAKEGNFFPPSFEFFAVFVRNAMNLVQEEGSERQRERQRERGASRRVNEPIPKVLPNLARQNNRESVNATFPKGNSTSDVHRM